MKIYTKAELISDLKNIRERGWIASTRPGNADSVGNTLEDLLGLAENNLPIPNAGEWELKGQRKNTTSLLTLFHMEPSLRAIRFVPQVFLPNYGWPHKEAGRKYPATEMSFRQTIHGTRSERGFKLVAARKSKKILVSFDAESVHDKHAQWLDSVDRKVGVDEINPQP